MTTQSINPSEVARTCLCLHVQRAARAVARHYDRTLRPLGLTNGQFSILMLLNRPQPVGMAELADPLGMDRTTLTAALKPLARRGLLRLDRNPADYRARQAALTEAGRALIGGAVPLWQRAQAELSGAMVGTDLSRRCCPLHSTSWSRG